METKRIGSLVLGIHHQRKHFHLGARRPQKRVARQGGTKLAPLVPLVNRKTAKPCNRHKRIVWQSPLKVHRQQINRQA